MHWGSLDEANEGEYNGASVHFEIVIFGVSKIELKEEVQECDDR